MESATSQASATSKPVLFPLEVADNARREDPEVEEDILGPAEQIPDERECGEELHPSPLQHLDRPGPA